MKRIIYLIVLLFLVSCQKEELFKNKQGNIRVTAGFADTRTSFTEDGDVVHVSWEKGDVIGLYTKEQHGLSYYAQEAGRTTEFHTSDMEVKAADGDSVYACYPFSYSDGFPYVKMPRNLIQQHNTDYDFVYAAGKVKSAQASLQFKHFYAFLKITVPSELIPDRGSDGGIYVTSSEGIGDINGIFNIQRGDIDLANESSHIRYIIPDSVQSKEITCYIAILPQSEKAELKIYHQSKGEIRDCLLTKKAPIGGLRAGNIYTLRINESESENQRRLDREALIELYQATNGDEWTNNTNWCSDKPIGEWYGVGTNSKGEVYRLDLSNNNLRGYLPESIGNLKNLQTLGLKGNYLSGEFPATMSKLMDHIDYRLFVEMNYFSGKIPESIKNHPNWKTSWIHFISQNGTGIDLDGVVIPAPDFSVIDISGNLIVAEDEYAKNKLTVLYRWAEWCPYSLIFNDKLIPLYDFYKKKGLEIIGFTDDSQNDEVDSWKSYIKKNQIPWKNFVHNGDNNDIYAFRGHWWYPAVFVIDSNKHVVFESHTKDYNDLPQIIAQYLGDFEHYTSTDYSRDGEIITLQKATAGKGIDLVFMGEAFVDKDMEPDGKYEQKMKEAMEQYFAMEPYKSFRDYFNVYAVKVVSPNAEFGEGAQHRINLDDNVCFEYARKIPNINTNRLQVSVIYNTASYAGRSYTVMYSDGSFVGYMMEGVNNVLNHEVGGHGFAKLLDEYVELGYENMTISEDDKSIMDVQWTNWGWGANVDWRNDATTVKWAHFMKDARYANDGLGVYLGAATWGLGCYRPTENSMMRYNDSPFNAPSREQIYKTIMRLSIGEDWQYDYEEFVKYDAVNRTPANTRALQTRPSEMVRRNWQKRHRQPIFVNGTWRDAVKKQATSKIVPLR